MPGKMRSRYSSTVTSAPTRRPHRTQLQADQTRADDDELLWYPVELERFGAGHDDLTVDLDATQLGDD